MQERSKIDKTITPSDVPDPSPLPEMCGFSLLVRPLKVKEKTKSGLYLPDQAVEDLKYLTNIGRVLAMGPLAFKSEKFDSWCQNRPIEVGDIIVFGRHDGDKIKYKGVNLTILKDISARMRIENPEDLDTSINLV